METRELLDTHPYRLFDITHSDRDDQQVIFVDEVQYLKNPSNFLKLIYDMFNQNIKLVVSWSSSFYIDQKFKDSLMGRKKMFELFTLDFEEFLDFKDEQEIKKLMFDKKIIPITTSDKSKIDQLFSEYITYGWYPEVVLTKEKEEKKKLLKTLSSDYIKKDIYEANIDWADTFLWILKVLAGQIWELVNVNDLSKTFRADHKTVNKYLYIMKKSYSIALIKPFWSNVKAELTKMPKVFFLDLGLKNSLIDDFRGIHERLDKGHYFENILWRELILRHGIDEVNYRRTAQDNEVDFIVNEKIAYEAKFSENLIAKSKYTLFRENYPNIPLEFITFDTVLEKIILEK